jgi:hypothetical protein
MDTLDELRARVEAAEREYHEEHRSLVCSGRSIAEILVALEPLWRRIVAADLALGAALEADRVARGPG